SIAPLRFLGTISYGIYLWSWPITQMVSVRHTSLDGWTLVFVQVALTLLAAIVSWVVIEQPILGGSIRPPWSGRVLAVGAVAAAVAVLASTTGAIATPSTSAPLAGYSVSAVHAAPRLMVVGDSVPNRIAEEGIVPLRNQLGVSVVDRTVPGCILLRSIGKVKGIEGNIRTDVGPCDVGWKQAVQKFRPQVVMMMFGEFPNDQVFINGRFQLPCSPDYQREERAHLDQAIAELTSAGARVVIATAPGSTVSWVLKGVPPGMNARVACMNKLYQQVASQHTDTDSVDFAKLICPSENNCRNGINGVNLREDTLHFRGDAAKLVARWLMPRVLTGTGAALVTSRAPFCTDVAAVEAKITALVNNTTAKSSDPAARTDLINSMRGVLPQGMTERAPSQIRADIVQLVAHWNDILDRAIQLPPTPTAADLAAVIGDLATPVTHISAWKDRNCS
ncbi:MAG TPA: SGNH hydrolase domain-containing protein, partial [Acidimicrobiales bacterium]